MIEFLTSDPAIFVMASVGLVATGISIVRDARAQRQRASIQELPVAVESEKLAA